MGIFNAFSTGFKQGCTRATMNSYRRRSELEKNIHVIEPNHGTIITFKITVDKELMPTVIESFKTYFGQFNATVLTNSNILTVKFSDIQTANAFRVSCK